MKNKSYIILVVAIIMFGLFLVGGTYAWLSWGTTVVDNQYVGNSTCFLIDYTTGSALTGTLFQSKTPKGGLSGSVSMAIDNDCGVESAVGTLKLSVGSATNDVFFNQTDEDNNKIRPLKYAVYTSSTATTPVSSGVINSKSDVTIYNNFSLSKSTSTFYIYVWLDGEATDVEDASGNYIGNKFIDVKFEGYINASATQTE